MDNDSPASSNSGETLLSSVPPTLTGCLQRFTRPEIMGVECQITCSRCRSIQVCGHVLLHVHVHMLVCGLHVWWQFYLRIHVYNFHFFIPSNQLSVSQSRNYLSLLVSISKGLSTLSAHGKSATSFNSHRSWTWRLSWLEVPLAVIIGDIH